MAYSEPELKRALTVTLNKSVIQQLGLAKSVEEAAIQVFLKGAKTCNVENTIKEALTDLRELNHFQFSCAVQHKEPTNFKIGNSVLHLKFGKGTVTDIQKFSENVEIVSVSFLAAGIKDIYNKPSTNTTYLELTTSS
jgi:hypothetical protein